MIDNGLLQNCVEKDSETSSSRAGKSCDALTRPIVERRKNVMTSKYLLTLY